MKVFVATQALDREQLGDQVTDWLREHPQIELVEKIVAQSSADDIHCLTITLFYRRRVPR